MYDFPIYIVFAVWNFPLWILERFFHVDIFVSFPCIIYMKLILLPFLLGSAWMLYKICDQLRMDLRHIKWTLFLFLSSGFLFSSLFVMAQYDIFMLFFLLLGLYMYMKDKQTRFILFFAVAVSFKLFALMVFIPLLLLKQKKLLTIFTSLLGVMSVTIPFKVLFAFGSGGQLSSSGIIKNMITNNVLPFGLTGVYVYISAFIALCIFAYIKTVNSEYEINQYSIYIPFLSFALFFLFTPAYPYWFILLTPFLPVLILKNSKHFKLNLLLDAVVSCSAVSLQQMNYFWCYSIKIVQPMLWPKIFGAVDKMEKPRSVSDIYGSLFEPGFIQPALGAAFTACLIAILIINFPARSAAEESDSPLKIERSVVWLRMIAPACICILPVLVYFYSIVVYGFAS